MRQLESPDSLRNGAGKRAFLVPEQFAFEKPGRNGRAVDLYEGPLATVAEIVNCAGDELLAGPVSPRIRIVESVGATVCSCSRTFLQAGAFTDDFLEIIFGTNLILQVEFFFAERLRAIGHGPECKRVFHGDRDLIGDVAQQLRIAFWKVLLAETRNNESSERPAVGNQRQTIC